MNLFPAIDLYTGWAVRLYQGDYNQMTVYDKDPLSVAKRFRDAGAEYLHMVDLEGAKTGETPNLDTVRTVAAQSGLKVEIGGGIRSEEVIKKYLDAGVLRVILGTAASPSRALSGRWWPSTATKSPWAWTSGTALWPSRVGRNYRTGRASISAATWTVWA